MTDKSKTMAQLWQDSYLAPGNEAYLEALYDAYLTDPKTLTPEWQDYFAHLVTNIKRTQPDVSHVDIREHFEKLARQSARVLAVQGMESFHDEQQERVVELINAYRRLGHLQADLDPLRLMQPIYNPTLELAYYGFSDQDLKKTFGVASFTGLNKSSATLAEIHEGLRRIYCGHIGFEYMHINRSDEIEWIRERIEQGYANQQLSPDTKKSILDRLIVADGLEKYLGFKYVGQKRFSLEGGDSLIPMMRAIVNRGAEKGVKEMVVGMAHRGRLNVLVNIVGKTPAEIFAAFEGKNVSADNSGDVKYHLGYSSNVNTSAGKVHIALAFNPSHLEIVAPVVQGSVRARQRRRRDTDQQQVLAVQIHGDAAFAGQGCVMETFSMSQARWFAVGGSVHIVINNQVGFTTSNPKDARSTTYCTDVAKMVEAPILHVNGDDPEAVYFAALFAMDYRQTFKRDVVIDLVCYRWHGHNEADEPSATQPLMYKVIKSKRAPYQAYAEKLIAEGIVTENAVKQMVDDYRNALEVGKAVVDVDLDSSNEFGRDWTPYANPQSPWSVKTAVPAKTLTAIAKQLEILPEDFVVQPQVKKMFEARKKMTTGELPINWGYAETLAYATLLEEGFPIRLCGQDAARGTFAHRHAVLHDQNTDDVYIPLSHVSPKQAQINIVDSLLSEEAVLAFEYGYTTADPKFLVLWEAQFGDFANGAQVVIDQFISSGEQKWQRYCGLVMLLPHGYEGMGPEHSSARLERYLQLCAQNNMQVCMPTAPSQIFHLLRRQMHMMKRKPLIVMTPKSALRHPLAISTFSDLTSGEFKTVIPEMDEIDAKKVDRIVLCSGKVYYALLEARRALKLNHVALLRVEQLYPFDDVACQKAMSVYPSAKQVVWCQEEPQNQGAWSFIQPYLSALLNKQQTLMYVGRSAAASPAVGYHSVHEKEEEALVNEALMK